MQSPNVVADIMTRKVAVLHEEENLELLREGMEQLKFRHLPVVDGERLVGIVSDRDVLRATVSPLETGAGAKSVEANIKSGTFVAAIMTRDVRTVHPDPWSMSLIAWSGS
jgi:CBS domain-containing protein